MGSATHRIFHQSITLLASPSCLYQNRIGAEWTWSASTCRWKRPSRLALFRQAKDWTGGREGGRPLPRQKVIGKWSGGDGSSQNMAAIQRTLLWCEMNGQKNEEENGERGGGEGRCYLCVRRGGCNNRQIADPIYYPLGIDPPRSFGPPSVGWSTHLRRKFVGISRNLPQRWLEYHSLQWSNGHKGGVSSVVPLGEPRFVVRAEFSLLISRSLSRSHP